jgi:hypothetical protein
MQYWSSEGSAGFDLRVMRCKGGTREINESDRKQEADARQEKGTEEDGERRLRPGVLPLRGLSDEMQERGLWVV